MLKRQFTSAWTAKKTAPRGFTLPFKVLKFLCERQSCYRPRSLWSGVPSVPGWSFEDLCGVWIVSFFNWIVQISRPFSESFFPFWIVHSNHSLQESRQHTFNALTCKKEHFPAVYNKLDISLPFVVVDINSASGLDFEIEIVFLNSVYTVYFNLNLSNSSM